jgi:hypothetical protein
MRIRYLFIIILLTFGIYFTDPNTAYACGDSGTIIRTTNAGTTWSVQPPPLYEIFTDVWFTSALTGYITTWSGKVLKTTNGGITFVVPISNEIPDEFKLFQNYPNPFNSKSNIRYQISKSEFVRLQIFDPLGREIAVLVNQEQNPGIYLVTWDAMDFPSGIYYYRITAGAFTDVKKLVLVK